MTCLTKPLPGSSALTALFYILTKGGNINITDIASGLKDHHIIKSMSRKGNCLDNSMMENFFGIMKSELLYVEKFDSPQDFIKALEEYINYYNNKRIKSRLKGKESGTIPNPFLPIRIIFNPSNFLGALHFS